MSNSKRQAGRQTQSQLDDDKATRPTDLADADGPAMEDELSASIHIISTGEERRQRHQGSGDDNGFSVSFAEKGSAEGREGVDDDRELSDEIRPKDGTREASGDSNPVPPAGP